MYRVLHIAGSGWVVVNAEGRAITAPHQDRQYVEDWAESLNLARQSREAKQDSSH